MRRRRIGRAVLGIGALLVAGGIWSATHPTPALRRAENLPAQVHRAVAHHNSAAGTLAAAGGPTERVQVVTDPANSTVQWALAPIPAHGAWWFGVHTAQGWRWLAAVPGLPLPSSWPLPAREMLTQASRLAAGDPNAALVVPVPWNSLRGQVAFPVCWTARTVDGILSWNIVLPSTRLPHLGYELGANWTAANVATGDQALTGLVAVTSHPLTGVCATAP